MGTIEVITKAIDDELISSGKEYLLLGQANQLLLKNDIISSIEKSNKSLKKLLEEDKIPHAYQTKTTPKQWRIPLSKNGKVRRYNINNQKSNDKKKAPQNNQKNTICPYCRVALFIPTELINSKNVQCPSCSMDFQNPFQRGLNQSRNYQTNQNYSNFIFCPKCNREFYVPTTFINDDYIKCINCGNNFQNPLKKLKYAFSNSNDRWVDTNVYSWFQRNWWILAISIVITLGGIYSNNDNNNSNVRNSSYDGSVFQVEQYPKYNYLKDPSSYEGIEWSKVNEETEEAYKYWVRHKYRAKNSFGGFVIENKIFYLDAHGNVIGVKDF